MMELFKSWSPLSDVSHAERGDRSYATSPKPHRRMRSEEDVVLDAKAPVYSINLDKRLLQCGLSRHKAALEGRKKEGFNMCV